LRADGLTTAEKEELVRIRRENRQLICETRVRPISSRHHVMCLDRRGDRFARFFCEFFSAMFDGTPMPVAWVNLAPQRPGEDHVDGPESIMSAEAGQIVFARSA
jgi:hypothetical protein